MVVQRNGGIVVGIRGPRTMLDGDEVTLLRLNPDGTRDTTFASAATRMFSQVEDIAVGANDYLLVCGDRWPEPDVVRLTADGGLDPSFVCTNRAEGVSICPNGDILMWDRAWGDAGDSASLVRCSSSGSVEADYSEALRTHLNRPNCSWSVLEAVGADTGQILVLGSRELRDEFGIFQDSQEFAVLVDIDGSVRATFDPEFLPESRLISGLFDRGEVAISGCIRLRDRPGVYGIARFGHDGSFQPGGSVQITATPCAAWAASVPSTFVVGQLRLAGGSFLVAGSFDRLNGVEARNVAVITASGNVTTDFTASVDKPVYAAAQNGQGEFILLGRFQRVNGVERDSLCTLDASGRIANGLSLRLQLESTIDPWTNPESSASAIVESEGRLLLCGWFNRYDYHPRPGFAALDLTGRALDPPLDISGHVEAACVQADGKILIGGEFSCVNGVTRSGLARLKAGGTLDESFHPVLVGDVPPYSDSTPLVGGFACDNNERIYVMGDFTSVNGEAKTNFARLNLDGSLDPSFTFDFDWTKDWFELLGLTQEGGALVWWNWDRVLKLLPSGPPDPTYEVQGELAIHVGKGYLLTGDWREWPRGLVLRLIAPDGAPVTGFSAEVGGELDLAINDAFLQADGKLVIGGTFASVNGTPAGPIARLDVQGALDWSFEFQHDFAPGGVDRLVNLRDGRFLAQGVFTSIDGQPMRRLALFHNLDSPRLQIAGIQEVYQTGSTAQLRAVAPDSATLFQWYKDDEALRNQTNSVLTLASVTMADSGQYRVSAWLGDAQLSSDATPVRVVPVESPRLGISHIETNQAILDWPLGDQLWAPAESGSLAATGPWSFIPMPHTFAAGAMETTIASTQQKAFFRLDPLPVSVRQVLLRFEPDWSIPDVQRVTLRSPVARSLPIAANEAGSAWLPAVNGLPQLIELCDDAGRVLRKALLGPTELEATLNIDSTIIAPFIQSGLWPPDPTAPGALFLDQTSPWYDDYSRILANKLRVYRASEVNNDPVVKDLWRRVTESLLRNQGNVSSSGDLLYQLVLHPGAPESGLSIGGPFNRAIERLDRVVITVTNTRPRWLVAYARSVDRSGISSAPRKLTADFLGPDSQTPIVLDLSDPELQRVDLYFYGPGGYPSDVPRHCTDAEWDEVHRRYFFHFIARMVSAVTGLAPGNIYAELVGAAVGTAVDTQEFFDGLQSGDAVRVAGALASYLTRTSAILTGSWVLAAMDAFQEGRGLATIMLDSAILNNTPSRACFRISKMEMAPLGDEWIVGTSHLGLPTGIAIYSQSLKQLQVKLFKSIGEPIPYVDLAVADLDPPPWYDKSECSAAILLADGTAYGNGPERFDEDNDDNFVPYVILEPTQSGRVSGCVIGTVYPIQDPPLDDPMPVAFLGSFSVVLQVIP